MKVSLHHVTALARRPQRSFEFYVKKLGFEFVWKGASQDNEATPQYDFRLPEDDVLLSLQFYPRCQRGQKGAGFFGSLVLGLPERDWNKILGRSYRGREEKSGRHVVVDPDGLEIEIEDREQPALLGLEVLCSQLSAEEAFWQDFRGLEGALHSLEIARSRCPGILGYGSFHHAAFLTDGWKATKGGAPPRPTRWGVSSYFYSPSGLLAERVSLL